MPTEEIYGQCPYCFDGYLIYDKYTKSVSCSACHKGVEIKGLREAVEEERRKLE